MIPYFNYSFYLQFLSRAFCGQLVKDFREGWTVCKLHMDLGGSPNNMILFKWKENRDGRILIPPKEWQKFFAHDFIY
jgi:hypothetical protein